MVQHNTLHWNISWQEFVIRTDKNGTDLYDETEIYIDNLRYCITQVFESLSLHNSDSS